MVRILSDYLSIGRRVDHCLTSKTDRRVNAECPEFKQVQVSDKIFCNAMKMF